MAKTGRPKGSGSTYDEEKANQILALMYEGSSAIKACEKLGVPWGTLWHWRKDHPDFAGRYDIAREACLDFWAEQILADAADESRDAPVFNGKGDSPSNTAVLRDKLKVDAKKWILSKLAPKKYGEKITQELTGKDGSSLLPEIKIIIDK